MRSVRIFLSLAALCVASVGLPSFAQEEVMERITPREADASEGSIFTTREVPQEQPVKHVPVENTALKATPEPITDANPTGAANVPAPKPYNPFQGMKVPFGRAESAPVIPSGPRETVAVPVVDVDEIDAAEPAPAAPIAPEADPVKENPEEPTELTSPIFESDNSTAPRKILLRALNKVTAQSELLTLKPMEVISFGQLQIRAVTCQISSPKSQMDYAALLEISEKMPEGVAPKVLFRGWMYASSPSIASLEHPVYDVTMVECSLQKAEAKKEDKPSKDAKKPSKKTKAAAN